MSEQSLKDLLEAITRYELISARLSSPWQHNKENLLKIAIRQILIKETAIYQVSSYSNKQVFHRNLKPNECVKFIEELIPHQYRQGIFETSSASYHLLVNKHKQLTVIKKAKKTPLKLVDHNRTKKYLLPEGVPIPFLIDLGVMTNDGKIVAKKYDKFRQINRFLEMVDDILPNLPTEGKWEIVDFGCGKAYLTFALYHYLNHIKKRAVNITGLDLKKEVIEYCQSVAKKLDYQGLQFLIGDINSHQTTKKIDLMISLHACDTATDAALKKGILWGCAVILCVPCCQHELYSQVDNQALTTLLRHGILKERFAALATDAARAELLTIAGYDVQILEFIEMEHTPKNLLLRAIKNPIESRQQAAQERYSRFKQALQINPSLEEGIYETSTHPIWKR